MERLKNMGLKKSFFLLTTISLLAALLMTLGVYMLCNQISARYPQGGLSIDSNGIVTELNQPTTEQARVLHLLAGVQLFAVLVFPVGGLGVAGILFYRLKLKRPIAILQAGTERIRNHDLNFSIPDISEDELGRICTAFETMRVELLKTNQELWHQAEERKRLNAAFSHDLRNPVTVLKGSLKLMRQGQAGEGTLERMESYTQRIEQYIEVMSSIQRLEQMPVRADTVNVSVLYAELQETVQLLAPGLDVTFSLPDSGDIKIDHGIFLTVAENLIGNAARFCQREMELTLMVRKDFLLLMVTDDGPGFPSELLKAGPKPFGKMEENEEHFGMGLYGSRLLCRKHGGELCLKNGTGGGASVKASFLVK